MLKAEDLFRFHAYEEANLPLKNEIKSCISNEKRRIQYKLIFAPFIKTPFISSDEARKSKHLKSTQ